MISILPVTRIVVIIAALYAACIAVIVALIWQVSDEPTFWSSVRIALSGSTMLNFALLTLIYVGWKRLWSWFPVLNTLLFPDMNGVWRMRIHWQKSDRSGVVQASVLIKQDLLRISMEVFSKDSDSETLMAYPKKDPESGRPMLYYVYRVIPKNIEPDAGPSYEGAAILKLANSSLDKFSGNYFTSRSTNGHFELTR